MLVSPDVAAVACCRLMTAPKIVQRAFSLLELSTTAVTVHLKVLYAFNVYIQVHATGNMYMYKLQFKFMQHIQCGMLYTQ